MPILLVLLILALLPLFRGGEGEGEGEAVAMQDGAPGTRGLGLGRKGSLGGRSGKPLVLLVAFWLLRAYVWHRRAGGRGRAAPRVHCVSSVDGQARGGRGSGQLSGDRRWASVLDKWGRVCLCRPMAVCRGVRETDTS